MSPLTILNVASPSSPVGPDAVGPAEQTITAVDRSLTREGHRSLVIACEGSRVSGELLATPRPPRLLDERAQRAAWDAHRATIERALGELAVDLVHLHGADFHEYLPPPGPPVLVTLHLPTTWYPASALRPERPGTYLHGVSIAQHRSAPRGAVLLDPIHHGVATDELRPGASSGRHALVLGRLCPEQRVHLALDAAREAGLPLVIAGRCRTRADEGYLEREVVPRLDGRRRWLGPVDADRRRRLLAHARCLLVTGASAEAAPSAAMEALACGVPVVAFADQGLDDVIEPGVTGLVVAPGDVRGLARALLECRGLSRERCRGAAERRFSRARMTREYLRRYDDLVSLGRRITFLRAADSSPPAAPARPRVTIEVVSDVTGLERLAPEWIGLWRRCPQARVFQRPEWLLAWQRHLGPTTVRVLVVRASGELVGLVPLASYRRQHERALGLLGGGVSDVLDALIDPAHEAGVAAALQQHLARALEPWDVLDLERLPATSALLRLELPRTAEELTVQEACPVLELPLCPGDLRDAVSRRLLAAVDDAWRRLTRGHDATIARVGEADLQATLDAWFALQRGRAPSRHHLADATGQRFHRDAAAALAAAGLLRLFALRVDGRTAGVLHALREGRRVSVYALACDPALEDARPDDLLLRAAIDDAIRGGATAVDFLAGRAPSKYRWGGRDEPLHRRVLRRASAQGHDQAA